MKENLRAVMVGCGSMASAWLDSAKLLDVDVVGFVDISIDAAVRRRDQYNSAARVGCDLQEMLDLTHPDVVFDCTAPSAHHSVTMTALRNGCHVMGEKPMSDRLDHAREMVAAAAKSGKIYSVIQNQRYRSEIRRMRHFLESAAIGELNSVSCDFMIGAHFGGFREIMKHVLIVDMAIHTFDAGRYLCGKDPVSVYCKDWNPSGSWFDHGASAVAIFTMADGVVFNYRGSWCAEGFNTEWTGTWRFQASGGSALWNGGGDYAAAVAGAGDSLIRKPLEIPVPDFAEEGKKHGHRDLIAEFVRCVQIGGKPETHCEDNIKSVAMVLSAVESAETDREVQVVW